MNRQIICENVSLGYNGRIVCSDISFEVCEGDYLCIVGENGTGKSTLIKALLGLQKQQSGKIIFGEKVEKSDIGYLPQQTELQKDFPVSAFEIVISGCIGGCGLFPFYRKKEKNRATEAMKKLGIADIAGKCYRELSGGQQQRVLLARALCAAKKIILLDEPVAGLDPHAAEEMYSAIEKLNKEEGLTVIMVSHDPQSAEYARHILHLGKRPLFYGTKEEYINSDISKLFFRQEDAI